MINFNANVVVHIIESLSAEQINRLEHKLAGVRGVICTCAHIKTPHLMVIDYDPRTLQARQLVQHFQRHGLYAALVGGI